MGEQKENSHSTGDTNGCTSPGNETNARSDRTDSPGCKLDRRAFGRMAVAGLAGLTGLAAGQPGEERPKGISAADTGAQQLPPGLRREKRGDLYYRPLGATGLWVSELALGGSPSPPENVFLAAMERGVNFCDTSPRYSKGNDERQLGRVLRGRRDRILIATKFTPNRDGILTTADALKQVDGSLSRLDIDHVDVLCIHRATTDRDAFSDWVLEAIDRLRRAGKARFFGASVHNTSLEFNRRLIESGQYQVLLMPLNIYYDPKLASGKKATTGPKTLEGILKLAAQKGVAIVAMKSLAAGGLAKVQAPQGVSAAQAKLRWVLRRPEVSTILNEMTTFDYLKENLAASNADLSPAEEAYLRRRVRESSHAFCRMCRTCEATCPSGIPIPEILRLRMYAVDYGDSQRATDLAQQVGARSHLGRCQRCGTCEASCPWGVRTTHLLDDARRIVS